MKRGLLLLLTVVVLAVVGFVALSAQGHGVSNLLGAHAGDASEAAAAPLPPTQLVALPKRALPNGTEPIAVTLSAPVSVELTAAEPQSQGRRHVEHHR